MRIFRWIVRKIKKIFNKKSSGNVKVTIEQYIEGLSEVTDKQIYQMENEGYNYLEGECKVSYDIEKDIDRIHILLQMYFKEKNNEEQRTKVKMERDVQTVFFTEDTLLRLRVANEIIYEIKHP